MKANTHSFVLLVLCAYNAVPYLASAVDIPDLVHQIARDNDLDATSPTIVKAINILQTAGWGTEEALEQALPHIRWSEDLRGLPVSVKVALQRHFREKGVQENTTEVSEADKDSEKTEKRPQGPVSAILEGLNISDLLPLFHRHGIVSEAAFLLLDHQSMLHYMGLSDLGTRLKVLAYIKGRTQERQEEQRARQQQEEEAVDGDGLGGMTREEMAALFTDLVLSHRDGQDGAEGADRVALAELVADQVREHFDGIVGKVEAAIRARLRGDDGPETEQERLQQGAVRRLSSAGNAEGVAGAGLWIEDDAATMTTRTISGWRSCICPRPR